MGKMIGNERPVPEALAQMVKLGGTWAAYQNHALDSQDLGHLRFLKVGPGCTFEKPPASYPDSILGIGWRYCYVGMVNLETGEVK